MRTSIHNLTFTLLAALAMTAFCSCKTGQNVSPTAPKQTTTVTSQKPTTTATASQSTAAQQVAKSIGSWKTLKTGGSITLGGASSLSSSMQVRMIKGQSIYISARPLLGIEVARIVITGDSVLVVDKVHKRYVKESLSLLTSGVPIDVNAMQDIFLGRCCVLGKGSFSEAMINDVTVTQSADSVAIAPKEHYKGYQYVFNYNTGKITSLVVTPETGKKGSTYEVKYSDVVATIAGNIARAVAIASDFNGKAFNISLNMSNLEWNDGKLTIDTSTPKNYTRIDGDDIFSIIGG